MGDEACLGYNTITPANWLMCGIHVVIVLVILVDMPGRGGKSGAGLRPMKKPFKPKQQKKRFIRVKDPIIAVLMWGVQHSVSILQYPLGVKASQEVFAIGWILIKIPTTIL